MKMIKFVKSTFFIFISIFHILLTQEIQKNDLHKSPSDLKPVAEHRNEIIKDNHVSIDNNIQGNAYSKIHIGNIRDMQNTENNENTIGMDFAEQTNTQVKKQNLKHKNEGTSWKTNTNEINDLFYKNKEADRTMSALNIGTKVNDKNDKTDLETLTIVENDKPADSNVFQNILKSIYSLGTSSKIKYYHIQLKEKNFRWSLPLLLGSQKSLYLLHIVTSTPFTALYCSMNSRTTGSAAKLKYELTTSEHAYLIECRSDSCESLTVKKECKPLNILLPALTGFLIKPKKCTERFCDYVHKLNFLNLEKISDETDISLCSFDYTVGYDNIKGFYFSDSFYIRKSVKETYNYWGCITENDDLKLNDVNSGFLGLASYDVHQKKNFPSILNTFIKKSTSKNNIFALCLVEKGGFVTFGGYENAVFKSRADGKPDSSQTTLKTPEEIAAVQKHLNFEWIRYSNPQQSVYKLLLKGISCKEKDKPVNYNINEDVVADTYNYYLHVPEVVFTKINTLIIEKCKTHTGNGCNDIHDKGLLTIAHGSVNDYPKIELKFEKTSVYIEPSDYIIKTSGTKYKILLKTSNVTKLGIPFFLNKYVVFDNIKNRLGIGRSECKLDIDENDLTGINESIETYVHKTDQKESEEPSFYKKYETIINTVSVLCFLCVLGGIVYSCF